MHGFFIFEYLFTFLNQSQWTLLKNDQSKQFWTQLLSFLKSGVNKTATDIRIFLENRYSRPKLINSFLFCDTSLVRSLCWP